MPNARGGRRGIGMEADVWQKLAQASKLTVFGSEVVSPLADAVGLVDRHEADLAGRQQRQKGVAALADQPFRRYIQEAVASVAETRDNGRLFGGCQRAVVDRGRHPVPDERVDLVLHQRDEGRDDEGEARTHDSWRLEAE